MQSAPTALHLRNKLSEVLQKFKIVFKVIDSKIFKGEGGQ